ncbi:MAG: fused MFS/spermidine synthase [Planctomycetota bacterium]
MAPAEASRARGFPLPATGLLAFAGGFATMVVELAAVRVLAPSFGDSIPVWTNVIGVILLSLALGAYAGGFLADRGLAERTLPLLLGLSGGLVLAIPALAPRLAHWVLPEAFPLDRAYPVLVEASLSVTLLAFAPPVLMLGALSPMLIRLGSADILRVGRTAGLVYATGTIGALLGTFLTTYWLVPGLGLPGTYRLAGLVLIGSAVLVLLIHRRADRGPVVGLVLVAAGGWLFGSADEPAPVWLDEGAHERVLARVDSRYQRLWVVEGEEVGEDGRRRRVRSLRINEGLDSFHSVKLEGTPYTGGRYYDSFALLPFLCEPGDGEVRVLSLGCAAGSILRVVHAGLGARCHGVGVELDPGVLALAEEWFRPFGEPPPATTRYLGDLGARVYVQSVGRDEPPFDLICLDTYRSQFYIPAHLATREFFRALRGRLKPGGVLAINVGDFSPRGPVLSAVAGTMAAEFPTVESFRVGKQRNFLVLGHDRAPGEVARVLRGRERPAGLSRDLWDAAQRSGAYWTWEALPDDRCLTDDHNDLLRLHEVLYSRLGRG